jgi:GT2 family glycosyltransferase
MKKDLIDLSISIINTNNWKFLEPCLQSIIDNVTSINYELLVVDNASDDGSVVKIQTKFPQVRLTINEKRFGFAKNNNINLVQSRGRYIMLLNDDTIVLPGSIETAIKYLDNNSEISVLGCRMINPDGSFQASSARRFRSLLSVLISELQLPRLFPSLDLNIIKVSDKVQDIDLPQESGMIIRNNILEEIGFLDEDYFMFGEGADYCRRIKKLGHKIIYHPNTPIIHFGGVTLKRQSLNMYVQNYKSQYIFFQKDKQIKGTIYRFIILLVFLIKFLLLRIQNLIFPGRDNQIIQAQYCSEIINLFTRNYRNNNYPFATS